MNHVSFILGGAVTHSTVFHFKTLNNKTVCLLYLCRLRDAIAVQEEATRIKQKNESAVYSQRVEVSLQCYNFGLCFVKMVAMTNYIQILRSTALSGKILREKLLVSMQHLFSFAF